MSDVDLEKAAGLIRALSTIADNVQALYVVGGVIILGFVYLFTKMVLEFFSDSRNNNVIKENSLALGRVDALLTKLDNKLSSP